MGCSAVILPSNSSRVIEHLTRFDLLSALDTLTLLFSIGIVYMRKLWYMSLESYSSRYTYQLTEWTRRVFDRREIDYVIVPGQTLDESEAIVVGQVLDAHGRSYFGMSQMMNLVKMMREGNVTGDDVIFFEDMFQPGMESLPYIMDQIPNHLRPKIFVRCLAQTIDPDDFVHVWGMSRWMSLYEQMCNEFVTGVLATNEEMVAHMKIANWRAPIYNISGLSFGKDEVQERVGGVSMVKPFSQRSNRVGFAARFDQEKQPEFFMDLIQQVKYERPNVRFSVFSGGTLRSNAPTSLERARRMAQDGLLEIHENLSKNDYYQLLNDTRVLFNCALQDWVSNTVSEADALGANVLYPAYRSFPETFANDRHRLYVPWSMNDAIEKLYNLLDAPHPNMGKISDWNDKTIDRILDIVTGNGEKWLRSNTDYRQKTREEKYH
jgi:glycosyltransferase involved in cell wall biosynthesis